MIFRWITILGITICFFCFETLADPPVPCPDKVPTTGIYRNNSYGFQFEIPSNLKGYWISAVCSSEKFDCKCMADHGRIIPLSDGSDIFIEAYARFTDPDPEENLLANLRDAKLIQFRNDQRVQRLTLIGESETYLGKIHALRFRTSFVYNGHEYIEDRIIASSDATFELYLRTQVERYPSDVNFLEMILRTWQKIDPIE